MIDTRVDVSEALAALSRASRALAEGGGLDSILAQVAGAAIHGTGAEIAVVWLPERDGSLVARLVRASSSAHAAEIEGAPSRSRSRPQWSSCVSCSTATPSVSPSPSTPTGAPARSGSPAAPGRSTARRPASRCSRATWPGSRLGCATTAPRWAGRWAVRSTSQVTRSRPSRTTRRRQHVWRAWLRPRQVPRARSSGGFAAASWRSTARTDRVEPDPNLKRVARAILDEHRSIAVQGDRAEGRARHSSARRAAARRAAAPIRSGSCSGRGRPRSTRELRGPRGSRAPVLRTRT